jgi:hypothetical protein
MIEWLAKIDESIDYVNLNVKMTDKPDDGWSEEGKNSELVQ